MKTLGELIPSEKKKVKAALKGIPKAQRPFFDAEYSVGEPLNSRPAGTFVGLACKVCNRWSDYGHDDDCPVQHLSNEPVEARDE